MGTFPCAARAAQGSAYVDGRFVQRAPRTGDA